MIKTALALAALVLIAATRPAPKPSPDAALFAEARRVTANQMRDPDSARFRNLRKVRSDMDQGWKVCGEINAKNAYGGYVGYRVFVYFPSVHQSLLRSEVSERLERSSEQITEENKLFLACD